MALIKCSECSNDVSDKAMACPKCGNPITPSSKVTLAEEPQKAPVKRGPKSLTPVFALAGLFIVGFVAAGWNAKNQQEKVSAAPNAIHADDIVGMSSDSFGCEFEYKFGEALDHYNRREMAAWAKIVTDAPWCFSGSDLKPGQTWTVLQVRGNAIQIAQTTVAQYEKDPSRHKHSYWTSAHWAMKTSE